MTQTGKTTTHTDKLLDLTQQFPQAFWDPVVRADQPESVKTPDPESAPTPESLRPVEIETPIPQHQTKTRVSLGQTDSAASHGQTTALKLDENEVLPLSSPLASHSVEATTNTDPIDVPDLTETNAPSTEPAVESLHPEINQAPEPPAQPQPVQPQLDPLAQENAPIRLAYPPRSGRSTVDSPMDTGLQALMGTFPDAFNSPTSESVAALDADSVEAQQPESSEQETVILPVVGHEEGTLPVAIPNPPDTTPDVSPAPLISKTNPQVSENTASLDAHDSPVANSPVANSPMITTNPVAASVEGPQITALADDGRAQAIVDSPEQHETLPTSTNKSPEQGASEGSDPLVLPSKDYNQALQRHLQTMTWGQIEVYLTYGQQGLKSIWITVGKSGTEVQSLCEAITRLVNLLLAHQVPIDTICRQIRGIRGADSEGFGPHRVLGLADLIGKALQEAPEQYPVAESDHPVAHRSVATPPPLATSHSTQSQTTSPAPESDIDPAPSNPSKPELTAPSGQTDASNQTMQVAQGDRTKAAAPFLTSASLAASQAWSIPDHNSLTAMLCPECGAELQHMNGCSGGACPVCGFSSCS